MITPRPYDAGCIAVTRRRHARSPFPCASYPKENQSLGIGKVLHIHSLRSGQLFRRWRGYSYCHSGYFL